MTYETDCPCGKVLTVQAADAGGTVRCACGRELDVPALSKLRRLDPPPPPPAPPAADYAHLRVPGVIVAVTGVAMGILGWCLVGREGGLVGIMASGLLYTAQVVGVALVCVSKRFPVFMCLLFPPFAVLGLVPAMLIPERLPPVPPPAR